MKQKVKFGDKALANLIARPDCGDGIRLGGIFDVVCKGPDGKVKWQEKSRNLVTYEGRDYLLNCGLHGATQITTWYVIPFEDNHTVAAGDTYATPGFTESTAYDEASRQEYVEAAASSGTITNAASKATITISASKTIYGAAIVGGGSTPSTKGDAAGGGTLLCASQFGTARSVEDDDTLEITYTFSAADDGV